MQYNFNFSLGKHLYDWSNTKNESKKHYLKSDDYKKQYPGTEG